VVVLPTADAFEQPELLVAAAMNWGERLGIDVEALMVLRRGEATELGPANMVRNVRAVYLVDQPLHLRSVLKNTRCSARSGSADGGLVVGTGGSADAVRPDGRPAAVPLNSGWCPTWPSSPRPKRGRPSGCTTRKRQHHVAVLRTARATHQCRGTGGQPEVSGELSQP
jgi:hypothetical protein